jgi:hypothetical protein
LTPGQVHAREGDGPADELLRPQHLPEEDDARGDPREGDQVLVDEDPVGPDAGALLPRLREPETTSPSRLPTTPETRFVIRHALAGSVRRLNFYHNLTLSD